MNFRNCIKHKVPKNHEEWKKQRLHGIGGSDAGAVLGFNSYKSPYALWCEKTGRIVDDEDNEAMRVGRDLEQYVAERFCEATGKKVKKSTYSFQSKDYPFMLANVDRLIVGEDAGLECKTASALNRTKWDKGDIPATYYAQCMHYMAVTGAKRWYIAILVMGKEFHWFTVERDEEEIKALIEAEEDFWNLVERDVAPNVDDSESTSEAISERYAMDNGDCCNLVADREEILDELMILKDQKSKLEKEIAFKENLLKDEIKDYQKAICGNYIINWKTSFTERVDSKLLKEKFPEVYREVLRQSTSRRFSVKEL